MVETLVGIVRPGQVQSPVAQGLLNVETGDYITNITKLQRHRLEAPGSIYRTGIQQTFDYYQRHRAQYW